MDVAPKDLSQIASAMATIGQTEARNQLHHFISALWVKSVMKIFWSQMSGLSPLRKGIRWTFKEKVLPVQNGVCVGCLGNLQFTWNSLGFRSILTRILKDLYLPQERFFASLARASVARAERFAVEVPLWVSDQERSSLTNSWTQNRIR